MTENRNIEGSKKVLEELAEEGGLKYAVMAKEKAPTTGHEHAHIYLYCRQPKTFTAIKKLFKTADIERARGTISQAYKYVTKDGDVMYEYGERPKEAKGIEEVWKENVEAFKRGEGDKETRLYARYQRFFDNLENIYKEDEIFNGELQLKNIWIYGPPGTGKSRSIREYAKAYNLRVYCKLPNKWWDGYSGEPIVLIEDLDPDKCTHLAYHIKLWSDRYKFLGECKGSTKSICSSYLLAVTSNYSVEECFVSCADQDAIKRRFRVYDTGAGHVHGSDLFEMGWGRFTGIVPDNAPREPDRNGAESH